MLNMLLSSVAVAATFAGVSANLGAARRQLQGAAASCSPTDSDLLSLIEVTMMQNSKIEEQTAAIQCLLSCQLTMDTSCACPGVTLGVSPPPPAPVTPVTPVTPAPPPTPGSPAVNGGFTLQVTPDYAQQLGTDAAFADCFLTPDEIASDPEAAAFAAAAMQTIADNAGVDVSTVTLSGISTDGDDVPGCDGGGSQSGSSNGMVMNVSPEFAAQLGTDLAFVDCWLTPEEIANDAEAAAFALAFVTATAAALGVDPASVIFGGISTAGLDGPGCNPSIAASASETTFQVDDAYAAVLSDGTGFDDCVLSPAEIAADADAAALAQAFAETQAANLGVDVSDITITSITATAGSGCGAAQAASSGMQVAVTPEFLVGLGGSGFLDDCWISSDEIAADPDAAAFAAAIIATQAATLGVDPSTIMIDGISTEVDSTPGCSSGETGRRMQEVQSLPPATFEAAGVGATRLTIVHSGIDYAAKPHYVSRFSIGAH